MGGLTIAVVALLLIKVSDIINFTWKTKYFKQISQQFSKRWPKEVLIDWEDKEGWENFYRQKLEYQKDLVDIAKTSESFRDYCYSEAEISVQKSFEDCDGRNGWCNNCTKMKYQ
ncbi:hypothetical protein A6V39_05445 [Candidatus Mycoplasma haematobovis]|uniref:Uncharacterized protein n=1 Tax=Candidatus Mycoplasma haematobovis TaxID=432608 RepID=A0A1A9QBW9_9MOLU|nr:hypothetical protein [Candidatus Mycoplasma haematobovis]OAL09738.1 hypothetical protein A6V39_05445 [Candidatus Mycoplasma haematobovis]